MYMFLVFLTSWTSIFFIGINGCFDKNKKYALSLLLYLILTALAGVNFGGQSITFFYLLGLFIFATFRRPHKLLNCFGVVYSYLMVILADYLFQTGILFFFHISTVEMSAWQYLFASIFYIPYIYLITKLSSLLLFRIIRIQTFYQNALVPVYVLNLGLCLMILYCLSFTEKQLVSHQRSSNGAFFYLPPFSFVITFYFIWFSVW